MANDLVLNVGYILPMGYADLQADDKVPKYAKGQFGLIRDNFGVRLMHYMRNALAAGANAVAGGLYSRAADVPIASIDAGSTTTLIKKAAGFTASAQIDWLMYYKTNATTPGAAPEGETALITANTAGALTLDSKRPLSATPNAADAIVCYSLFDFIKSAVGDLAQNVFGVCVATSGITNGNWGVLQSFGFCPDVKFKAAVSLVAGKSVIADVEQVTASAASAESLLVGWAPEAVNATNASKTLIRVNVFDPTMASV